MMSDEDRIAELAERRAEARRVKLLGDIAADEPDIGWRQAAIGAEFEMIIKERNQNGDLDTDILRQKV